MELEELIVYEPKRIPHNFKDYVGFENEYLKVISRAPNKNGRTQWNCQCKSCGKYCVKDSNNLKTHKSCGCMRSKLIGDKLRKDLTGKRFGKLTVLKYSGKSNSCQNAIWICQCDCGNICEVDGNNLTSNHTLSCSCINFSIGAQYISNILKENKISYQAEYSCKDLYFLSKEHPARFDFALLDENNNIFRLIEYDGIQHYKETLKQWKSRVSLTEQQRRDKEKNDWAKQHNIPLVRIPYWERDNISLDMLLGDKYLVK